MKFDTRLNEDQRRIANALVWQRCRRRQEKNEVKHEDGGWWVFTPKPHPRQDDIPNWHYMAGVVNLTQYFDVLYDRCERRAIMMSRKQGRLRDRAIR